MLVLVRTIGSGVIVRVEIIWVAVAVAVVLVVD